MRQGVATHHVAFAARRRYPRQDGGIAADTLRNGAVKRQDAELSNAFCCCTARAAR